MAPLSVRFRIDFGEACAIGPGKIALLEAVADTGSLSAAARRLGMSYRRAWLLLESLNTSFRQPVVELSKGGRGGGGAVLTAFGAELVAAYRRLESEMARRARANFRSIARSALKGSARGARRRPLQRPAPR